jgi:hypothetical protein
MIEVKYDRGQILSFESGRQRGTLKTEGDAVYLLTFCFLFDISLMPCILLDQIQLDR